MRLQDKIIRVKRSVNDQVNKLRYILFAITIKLFYFSVLDISAYLAFNSNFYNQWRILLCVLIQMFSILIEIRFLFVLVYLP